MSDSDSFIREVSEEVRRERLSRLLGRYGWIAALVILVIVGGAGFNEWRKARIEAAAREAGDRLREAYLVEDPSARAAALADLAAESGRAAPLARFAQAGALVEAGEEAEAAALLETVSEDPALPSLYRDLALLQRVSILGDDLDRSERLATLETLSRPDGPYRLLALEQRALVRLEAGELDQARADLEAILTEPAVPETLAARTRQLLIAAGGELPGLGPAAAATEAADPADAAVPAEQGPLAGANG